MAAHTVIQAAAIGIALAAFCSGNTRADVAVASSATNAHATKTHSAAPRTSSKIEPTPGGVALAAIAVFVAFAPKQKRDAKNHTPRIQSARDDSFALAHTDPGPLRAGKHSANRAFPRFFRHFYGNRAATGHATNAVQHIGTASAPRSLHRSNVGMSNFYPEETPTA